MDLNDNLRQSQAKPEWQRPEYFSLSKEADVQRLQELFAASRVSGVYDQIDSAVGELFDIRYPAKKDTKTPDEVTVFRTQLLGGPAEAYGVWVYYPWSGNLVHFPPKQDYQLLRTARNRNLITHEEQAKLQHGTVLVVGLSVGSNAIEMLLAQGIGGRYVLVDMDIIETTNLNRIKLPYHEVGVHKVDAVAKRISEIDPFIEQLHYKQGLDAQNLTEIFEQHQPDVVIDEMDDLAMKIKLRQAAQKHHRPVLMATDDGENALLDIERYDILPDQKPFEGRLSDEVISKVLAGDLSRPEIGMLIGKHFVGGNLIPLRMFESLREVGRSLPSWPQLAGAATLSGVVLAYAAKKILLDQPLTPGRHFFDLDGQLDPAIKDPKYQEQLEQFRQMFNS